MSYETSGDSKPDSLPISASIAYEAIWDRTSGETPVTAVVTAITAVDGCDPTDLPPLYEAIDPDALTRSFPPNGDGGVDRLVFQYAGYDVTVTQSMIQLR